MKTITIRMLRCLAALLFAGLFAGTSTAQLVDKQKLLDAQTFWDNRDWDWYKANIPFLDTPDADINATYYYRWEVAAIFGSARLFRESY